jgi:hypothetical protein
MDNAAIDRETNVREVILGTSIYGKARVAGKPDVRLVPSVDDATFHITLEGTIRSQTIGYNGPVRVHSHSVTTFTASRPVVFEPWRGFYGLPSHVSAHTKSFLDGISSTRPGLIGRIICRRARKTEAAQHAQATEIARQKAESRIKSGFDRTSEQRLARLNKVADFRTLATAALRATGRGEPRYACCTTPHYLQFAARLGDSGAAIELPANDKTSGASIEIWIHESLMRNPVAFATDWGTPSGASGAFLRPFTSSTGHFEYATIAGDALHSITGNRFQLAKLENWQVIQVDVPIVAKSTLAASFARAIEPSSKPVSPPVMTNRRVWTSGAFTADAEFLSLDGNVVRLRRPTGIKTSIPLNKLSLADRNWIKDHSAVAR